MAFVSDMFDQLRDLLNDVADTQVSYATKKLYLNRGISRLWPRIWRIAESTVTLTADTQVYALASATYSEFGILSVEYADTGAVDDYVRFDDYDVIESDEDVAGYLRLSINPPTGATLRIRYLKPVSLIVAASYAAAQSEVWLGPDRAMNLPVLYALGMIAARRIDDRQDYSRYSTTQALNGVTDTDIMQASQFWFGQFELEIADMERVMPVAKD